MAAKRKRVTLNEFRAWLEGVEELQPEGWCPSADQWKLIRAKIDNIKDEAVKVLATPGVPQQFAIPQQPAVNSGVPPGVPAPPMVGGVPGGNIDMTPEAKNMLSGNATGKTLTPNIDTSDGKFQSSFS